MQYFRPIFGPKGRMIDDVPVLGQTDRPITGALRFERGRPTEYVPIDDVPKAWLENWKAPRHWGALDLAKPCVMGILNVTPDSFSDGGSYTAHQSMMDQIDVIIEAGCDILDIGGESTRPGAAPVASHEEMERIIPALRGARARGIPISVDTRKADVAQFAHEEGADFINDISGLSYDPHLAPMLAQRQTPVCVMHSQGDPQTMQNSPHYDDVLLDVYDFLYQQVSSLLALGMQRRNIMVDPGIGFGKTQEHNLALLRDVALFHGLGVGVLIGVSRKRFIGTISGAQDSKDRFAGSIAVGLATLAQGVQVIRVHDAAKTVQAVKLFQAVEG